MRKTGIEDGEQALEEALAFKRGLMRAGLVTGVPMLFGNDTSGTRFGEVLVDLGREQTGATPRSDVHGVEVTDEGDGPIVILRMEGEGHVVTSTETFLGALSESLDMREPTFALDDRLALAIQVFMAAETEPTTRVRFLQLVTALEILAEQRPISNVGVEVIEAALAQLEARRGELEYLEAQSLQTALSRLRNESIGRSVRALGEGLDPDTIDGYRGGDIARFLNRCYEVRSTLVHKGDAPNDDHLAQVTGDVYFLLKHILSDASIVRSGGGAPPAACGAPPIPLGTARYERVEDLTKLAFGSQRRAICQPLVWVDMLRKFLGRYRFTER